MDRVRPQTSETAKLQENTPQESIFKYYSIGNEVDFLRKVRHIPLPEQQFYLRENVFRFLGEFAGQVPYTKISYKLKDNNLYFADIPAMKVYEETAAMTPEGSRERAEYEGMLKIQQELVNGKATSALMISPSKIANYALAFWLTKRGDTVDEYILRYPETLGKTDASARVFEEVAARESPHNEANDYIRNPLFFRSSASSWTDVARLTPLMIRESEVAKSRKFEEAVAFELGYWVDQYAVLIKDLASYDKASAEYKTKEKEAKIVFTAIFNMARDIKDRIDGADTIPLVYRQYDTSDAEVIRFFYNRQSDPFIAGGGSCIVTSSGDEHGFLSSSAIHSALSKGNPLESTFIGESFDCPECGKPIPTGRGLTQCPHCFVTKDQVAAKTGKRCD